MSGKTYNAIEALIEDTLLWPPNPALKADELDKMWADYGRIVHHNMMHPYLLTTLNRACLTCSNHIELAAVIRAFLLTGVVPHERPQRK